MDTELGSRRSAAAYRRTTSPKREPRNPSPILRAMSALVLGKLAAIFAIALLGWVVGKLRWLGPPTMDPARTLSNAAFYIFVPALLFRTTARLEAGALPWSTLESNSKPWMPSHSAGIRLVRHLPIPCAASSPANSPSAPSMSPLAS